MRAHHPGEPDDLPPDTAPSSSGTPGDPGTSLDDDLDTVAVGDLDE